ncbi:MAG: hypothetical protein PHH60_05850 [Candidatus Margulisbacteria bacterium]|nr:hypothetical protein [Candidatus Margulisiibacteriota bacterium]
MSLLEIEKKIIAEAEAEAAKVKQEAAERIKHLEITHNQKKEALKTEIEKEILLRTEEVKRSYLVPARLKAKKALLEAKQSILSALYSEIQKERKLSTAEINRLREETEVKVAGLLFGE